MSNSHSSTELEYEISPEIRLQEQEDPKFRFVSLLQLHLKFKERSMKCSTNLSFLKTCVQKANHSSEVGWCVFVVFLLDYKFCSYDASVRKICNTKKKSTTRISVHETFSKYRAPDCQDYSVRRNPLVSCVWITRIRTKIKYLEFSSFCEENLIGLKRYVIADGGSWDYLLLGSHHWIGSCCAMIL